MPTVMTISINHEGKVVNVSDGKGKKVKKLSQKAHQTKMKGKKILDLKTVMIGKSNPCIFITTGNGGYWICW